MVPDLRPAYQTKTFPPSDLNLTRQKLLFDFIIHTLTHTGAKYRRQGIIATVLDLIS